MRKQREKRETYPCPTPGAADILLDKAKKEVATDPRQAAEKGWLAVVTAVRALLRASGGNWKSTQRVAENLSKFETAHNMSHNVSSLVTTMARNLHGSAFYRGDPEFYDNAALESSFNIVEQIIDNCESLCRFYGSKRSR